VAQPKAPLRRGKPTFSSAIPPVVLSDAGTEVPRKAVKAVERLHGVLDYAKTTVKKAEKSKP